MSGTTEKLSLVGEQVKLPIGTQQELGRCASCPLMAMGCPGKQEVAAPCPPKAEVIEKKELSAAIMNDAIGSVSIDGKGGYFALPEKAAAFQSAVLSAPKPKQNPNPKPTEKRLIPKPTPVKKRLVPKNIVSPKKLERTRQEISRRTRQEIGSAALSFGKWLGRLVFGDEATAPAKK